MGRSSSVQRQPDRRDRWWSRRHCPNCMQGTRAACFEFSKGAAGHKPVGALLSRMCFAQRCSAAESVGVVQNTVKMNDLCCFRITYFSIQLAIGASVTLNTFSCVTWAKPLWVDLKESLQRQREPYGYRCGIHINRKKIDLTDLIKKYIKTPTYRDQHSSPRLHHDRW